MRHYRYVVLALLAGCATQPAPTSEAKLAKDILDSTWLRPLAGAGMLVVKRDPGILGSGCSHRIIYDGKPVADLTAGEVVTLYTPPGDHFLRVEQRCLGTSQGGNEMVTPSISGKTSTFRTTVQPGGVVMLMPTSS